MTDLRQAAQQAIEALDCVCNDERTCDVLHHGRAEHHAIGASCPAVKRLWVARHNLSEALAAVSSLNGQVQKMDVPQPSNIEDVNAAFDAEYKKYKAEPQVKPHRPHENMVQTAAVAIDDARSDK